MSCGCDIKIINEENKIIVTEENNVIVVSHADGRDGKSAYQQAVEGGYTGTEQEFNCSLSLLADVKQVKENLVSAIEYKGGKSSADKSLQGIAEDIKEIPNFNTNGCEYINEVYKPTTLLDAYYNRRNLISVVDNYVEEISGSGTFVNCSSLHSVEFPNLVKISGSDTFGSCPLQSVEFPNLVEISGSGTFKRSSLQSVEFPNLVKISGSDTFEGCPLQSVAFPKLVEISNVYTFYACNSLQSVEFPNLVKISATYTFYNCNSLQSIELGTLIQCSESFYNAKPNLRNVTIGQDTDINLPFQKWTATNVINEGQSGIDELNNNLRTNLLEKLADHRQDGQTRTLRLGWLAHVTQENIDYANSKGWTLTT